MRGKRVRVRASATRARIIPAHAGQTATANSNLAQATDHPRACGANVDEHFDRIAGGGSSPRMRGKLDDGLIAEFGSRIIPAHAGQTRARSRRPYPPTDHPRACGANLVLSHGLFTPHGSSPRMRGKHLHCGAVSADGRIIPAHAGQTWLGLQPPEKLTDHPRACGANTAATDFTNVVCGSSPRMRGKPVLAVELVCRIRIIPAHAGQTQGCESSP